MSVELAVEQHADRTPTTAGFAFCEFNVTQGQFVVGFDHENLMVGGAGDGSNGKGVFKAFDGQLVLYFDRYRCDARSGQIERPCWLSAVVIDGGDDGGLDQQQEEEKHLENC